MMIKMMKASLLPNSAKKPNDFILVSGETVNIISVLQTHTPGGAFTDN